METGTKLRSIAHHLIRAFLLGGFAFYIIRLVRVNSLTLYIAPRMTIYVKLAAMGLYVVAAVQLYQALRHWIDREDTVDCECGHEASPSLRKSAGVYALFLIPLLVLFFTPDTTIGSAMAGKKGMNLSASSAVKAQKPSVIPSGEASSGGDSGEGTAANKPPDPLDALFPADQFSESYANYGKKIYKQPVIEVTEKSYMEILTTVDMFLDNFIGKKMSISGFVYRDDSTGEGRFVIGRFAVQCCTADAMPYGVMVRSAHAEQYANDTWLKITGTLEKTTYNGSEIMGLRLEKAEKIKPADDPYVYPDLDFGQEDPSAGG